MENVLKRHVNLVALAIALVAQIIGLAYQINVKRGDQLDRSLFGRWSLEQRPQRHGGAVLFRCIARPCIDS